MTRKKKVNHAYLALPLVLTTLFLLMVGFAGVASSSNYITIHIRPNGSIVPSDAPR
ncbi:MAG: hypothetical protein J7L98_05550 [Candidatus Verstraetearchaeota archaeon]|nr:hypothetical protein [Candidatus Verstraetearchaeota archaeon]